LALSPFSSGLASEYLSSFRERESTSPSTTLPPAAPAPLVNLAPANAEKPARSPVIPRAGDGRLSPEELKRLEEEGAPQPLAEPLPTSSAPRTAPETHRGFNEQIRLAAQRHGVRAVRAAGDKPATTGAVQQRTTA
jgi:hypothetical protein